MVKVKWKLDHGRVYLELEELGRVNYYWFPKKGRNKRFHFRSIFTRQIYHSAYKDSLIPRYVEARGWVEEEIRDEVVKEKLGIPELT